MNRQKYIFITSLVIFMLTSIIHIHSSNLYAEIRDSHHDFSGRAWNLNQNLCQPCHTPHNANIDVQDSPLWNHELSVAVYQTYTSSTLNSSMGQPTGKSKLCLSCHDGTVAIDSYGGNSGTNHEMSWQMGYVGTDLSHEHPISFEYNSALATADGELFDPSTKPSGLGGTIEDDLLDNGQMECSTCHDVHVARNAQGCNGCHDLPNSVNKPTLSLRIDNSGSAFCLTCHNK